MNRSDEFQRTKERLEARRGFLVHLVVYVVVNVALVVVNLSAAPDYLWAKWPMMGWGIGLFFHGLNVFVFGDPFSITDEVVQRELSKTSHT